MSHIRTLVVTPGENVARLAKTHTSNVEFDNTGIFHVFNRTQRPSYVFEIKLGPLTKSEVESIGAFHAYHMGGKAFYWDGHPYDTVENYNTIGEGDGSRREWFLWNRNVDANSFAFRTLRPSTGVASVWATTAYSLNAVPGIVTTNNSANTIVASGDDAQAVHAHRYKLVFDPEEFKAEEIARRLFSVSLKMRETAF